MQVWVNFYVPNLRYNFKHNKQENSAVGEELQSYTPTKVLLP